MKYFYCDSCFLITMYQTRYLDLLSQYKDQFFVSDSQIKAELIKPGDLASLVRKSLTVIFDREEIWQKASELAKVHSPLSKYDCLALAFAIIDGYCLVTDDTALIKAATKYGVKTKMCAEINKEFNLNKARINNCGT